MVFVLSSFEFLHGGNRTKQKKKLNTNDNYYQLNKNYNVYKNIQLRRIRLNCNVVYNIKIGKPVSIYK